MNIPAMDAVRSKRFGYISTPDANIAMILHDAKVPNRNFGGEWRNPRPVFIQTKTGVDVAKILEDPDNYEKHSFSESFWNEAAKIYRITSPEYEDKPENTDYDPENTASEFETDFLNNIVAVLNNNGVSHEVWSAVLEDAQWNRIEDNETGDVSLFGDDERTFEESDFSETNYLPDLGDIEAWGLYSYSWRYEGKSVDSLWVRFEDKIGNIREYPIVENLHGLGSIVSTDPDFGTIESNHLSDNVLHALENEDVIADDDPKTALTEMILSTDLSDKTQYFIENATDSKHITD